jgi:hypothetical protein
MRSMSVGAGGVFFMRHHIEFGFVEVWFLWIAMFGIGSLRGPAFGTVGLVLGGRLV